MQTKSTYAVFTSAIALIAAACGDLTVPPPIDNTGGTAGTAPAAGGSTAGASSGASGTGGMAGTGLTTGGGAGASAGTAGAGATGGSAGTSGAGAAGGSAGAGAAGAGGVGSGGMAGDTASGGTAGDSSTGGVAGTAGDTATGGMSANGGTGGIVDPVYGPRTGSFKMLVYSETQAFEHLSIPAGQQMLKDIAADYGFEVTVATDNSQITLEGLSQYEIVFFMNCTGDIFNSAQEAAFEEWMTTRNGAFAGAHSATDTERDWQFYKEVVGQYYDLHDSVSPGTIQWESGALDFVAVRNLPSPWQRNEEWYRFNSYQDWSSKEGFVILSKVTTNEGGTRPVSYTRQYNNFRSFYSSIGHESQAFQDDDVQKHFAAGIMWAVRREALVNP